MEDDNPRRAPMGLTMSSPLFKGSDLQSFLRDPPPRPIIAGTTSLEFDAGSENVDGLIYIAEFLGITNQDEILERYHKDELSGNIPFNHTIDTQQTFTSTYVIGHQMRKAGGKVYLYSYRNPRRPYHTMDLSFIMGIHLFEYDENDKVLSVIYPQFFIDFIKTTQPHKDWTPLQAELDNYMYIDVNVKNHSMPHMENYYEHDVINYWKNLVELDKRLSGQTQKAAAQRAIYTTSMTTSILDLLVAILLLTAIVVAVLMTVATIRQWNQRRQNRYVIYRGEKTPLLF
ncbi:hypothetical protein KIN20_005902 [Parelaphostrongylus tenuis]|uniref:Carboxylesterase type B domain-containing protein n=1 Tax=Parelaphostrongylus tenuis TaxID=148309 RepID=A0AAD5MTD9_PARTN|nr:hypothetical protein KIN20_005902 [Parelaphostrongylus tenuis]